MNAEEADDHQGADGRRCVRVVGGGPAGLMAAEAAIAAGARVEVHERMPSIGRKLLMAGRGGLNLTHSEPAAVLVERYRERRAEIAALLARFSADDVRAWAAGLGIDTFVGSSGRVFPREMKAAPLLRAWQRSLRASGVVFHVRHRWLGWDGRGRLRFATPRGDAVVEAAATVLALGGGSWARLGSDGAWVPALAERGVDVRALRPANVGFERPWSPHFRERFVGAPVKSVRARVEGDRGAEPGEVPGELIVTEHGIEGGLVYTLSAPLRDAIARDGCATLRLDLAPGRDEAALAGGFAAPRQGRSLAKVLARVARIEGVKAGLLRECVAADVLLDPVRLAHAIKALPLTVRATRPLDEAISTAGGVAFEAMDADLQLLAVPGTYCAGEMLDWEAPTGGYLLTACLASGRVAGAAAGAAVVAA